MARPLSLGRHLARHLTVLAAVLVAIYSLTIDRVYQWGLDDNTHYFLSLEADRVWSSLQRQGRLPPATSPNTQYYADSRQLPPRLLAVFPAAEHREGELLTAKIGDDVLYLLPYRRPDSGRLFYVAHTYRAAQDAYEVGPTIPQLLWFLAAGSLLVLALLVSYLAWSIIGPVRALERRAVALAPNAAPDTAAPALPFTELQAVAQRLQDTVAALAAHNQREQQFLRTLSHELRTPLAVIKAALTLLARKPEALNAAQERKLVLIDRANEQMLATTECLLWLWSGGERRLEKEMVHVATLLADSVASHRHLLEGKPVRITSQLPDTLSYCIERKLLELLLSNLLRNACQYTEAGAIVIQADASTISISNPLSAAAPPEAAPSAPPDYGYGIGLYLVQAICARQGWSLQLHHSDQAFVATITFSGTAPERPARPPLP